MYKIARDIGDTDGQIDAISAIMQLMTEAYLYDYNFVSETAIEKHLTDKALKQHRSYVLRLMQDRGMIVGVRANRGNDGHLVNLWKLCGVHMPQYNSNEIPDSDVLD